MEFKCPQCGGAVSAPDSRAGMHVSCPNCGKMVPAPETQGAPPPGPGADNEEPTPAAVPKAAPSPTASFVRFVCPLCRKFIAAPAVLAGRAGLCPACGARLLLPASSSEQAAVLSGPGEGREAFPWRAAAVLAAMAVALGLLVGWLLVRGGARTRTGGPPSSAVSKPAGTRTAVSPAAVSATSGASPAETPATKAAMATSRPARVERDYVPLPAPFPPPATTELPPAEVLAALGTVPAGTSAPAAASPPATAAILTPPELVDLRPPKKVEEEEPPQRPPPPETQAEPKTPAAAAPTTEAPKSAAKPPPPKDQLPEVCADCLGTMTVPLFGLRPYVWVAGSPQPPAQNAVPWRYCPRCQAKADPKELLEAEKQRLAGVEERNLYWDRLLGAKLVHADTRHASLRMQLPPDTAKKLGETFENLALQLESGARSTVLTQTRPGTFEILILNGKANYQKFLDYLAQEMPDQDWELARKCVGGGFTEGARHVSFYHVQPGEPVEPMAAHQFGKALIRSATQGKAPIWLTEGFAAYCENLATKRNLCYSIAYEYNEVQQIDDNWHESLRKIAQDPKARGSIKPLDQVFGLNLIGMKPVEYLECYSFVSYLFRCDGRKFARYLAALRDGMESGKALEKAYGCGMRDLQHGWSLWVTAAK